MRRSAPLSLRAQALAWLAQREHSRQELRDKLLRRAQAAARAAQAAQTGARGEARTEFGADSGGSGEPSRSRDAAAAAHTLAHTHGEHASAADIDDLPAQVEAVLDSLQAAGHLSDVRFVDSRVHARQARFGNRRIEQELRSKGVQADDALRARLRETELDRARAVWSARFAEPAGDLREQARQARFLAARGFSAATIQRLLRARDDD